MEPPKEIIELVERFDEHIEVYRSKDYKEAQLRVDFLNPFFNALGWDVYNTKAYDPEYREVVTEDRLVIGGETKAPDYSFRITSRERKFFVEAKQPYVNIFADSKSAFQLRRYAYTASLPLSILTTFDRFSVYDCRPEPSKDDRATDACIKQLTHKDYLKEWDFIYKTFARESIFKGSFDKYARETKTKTVIKPFDEVFLSDIESWRRLLAEDIAKNNKEITEQELNRAVQLTIDRILFMRICETKGYEKFGGLQGLMNGENIYGRLIDRYKEADKKYNSGLFHFHKEENREHFDGLSLTLNIGDGIFKQIFKRLYYPDCPYEYSVIEADILGSIYERFLGNVIYLSKDHQAKVDQKPEVRKAGGVYYTPSYIVKYIVENTVGKQAEGKTPEEVSKLRICDPACGSGSFLLEAFHFLLEWHHKYYLANKPAEIFKKKGSPLVMTADGNYKLSLAERKRILVNNIYGVDIDAQAVEVTKLSLLLKVIESLLPADLLDKRILPDLGTNIKCGNSLIGTDFFKGKSIEDWNKIRPFDWDEEFPEIFKNGGFDAVIGNPPYIRSEFLNEVIKEYYSKKYSSSYKQYDIYVLFIEKGILILKQEGLLGLITSNKFLITDYGLKLREFILENSEIVKAIDVSYDGVFKNVSVYPYIVILRKQHDKVTRLNNEIEFTYGVEENKKTIIIKQVMLLKDNIIFDFTSFEYEWIKKIESGSIPLKDIAKISRGFRPPKEDLKIKDLGSEKYLIGKDIRKSYNFEWSGKYVKYIENEIPESKPLELFKKPKIIFRDIGLSFNGCYDDSGHLCLKTIYFIFDNIKEYSLKYLLSILNSKLIKVYFEKKFSIAHIAGGYLRFRKQYVEQIPIHKLNNKKDIDRHDAMVRLVEQMLELNKRLQQAKTPDDKELLSRQIETTDRQIDGLVYELYELTPEDIAIVEESAK